jgi:hypothetical protein
MAVSAQSAIRAWINARDIVGEGSALSRGAYLQTQRSVADGAYAVVSRTSEGVTDVVAEGSDAGVARIQCLVFAGTEDASEAAAKALRQAFEGLTGAPQKCGTTDVSIMVAFNHLGPFLVPWAPDGGETYCHQVNADFLLTEAI